MTSVSNPTCNVFFSALHEAVDDGDHIRLHFEFESPPSPTATFALLPEVVAMHNTDSLNTAHWVAHVALPRQQRIRVRLVVHNHHGKVVNRDDDDDDPAIVAKTPSRLLIPRGVEMRVTLGAADPAASAWSVRDHVAPGHAHIRFLFGGVAAPGENDIRPSCLRWSTPQSEVAQIRVSSNLPGEVARTRLLEPPHTAQTSVTYTTTRDLADCRFLLELLAPNNQAVVARAWLLGSALADEDGFLRLPLLGATSADVLGEIVVYFLVVRAYAPRTADVHRVVQALPLRNIWKTVPSEDVGHRGSGAHNAKSSSGSRTWLAENTMLSFREAARNLLPFIEFDVQLSKDGVPVIWHDFHIADDCGIQLSVHDLTHAQFKRLHKTSIKRSSIGTYAEYDAELLKENPRWDATVSDQLATLEDIFKGTPQHVGFDIELKYPNVTEAREEGFVRLPPRNAFVDKVLDVVFAHVADERRIFFSSFDPDLCLMLHMKQTVYPVLFLTEAGFKQRCALDVRTASLQGAVMFARRNNMVGIVSRVTALLEDTSLFGMVKQHGLLLGTFGWENNDLANVAVQDKALVDFIVSDHIATYAARTHEMQRRAQLLEAERK
jgi:glycerophosphoryl diester phosphodiesterase